MFQTLSNSLFQTLSNRFQRFQTLSNSLFSNFKQQFQIFQTLSNSFQTLSNSFQRFKTLISKQTDELAVPFHAAPSARLHHGRPQTQTPDPRPRAKPRTICHNQKRTAAGGRGIARAEGVAGGPARDGGGGGGVFNIENGYCATIYHHKKTLKSLKRRRGGRGQAMWRGQAMARDMNTVMMRCSHGEMQSLRKHHYEAPALYYGKRSLSNRFPQ